MNEMHLCHMLTDKKETRVYENTTFCTTVMLSAHFLRAAEATKM